MSIIPDSIQELIEQFSRLPGIGPKTASRLTFYLLSKPNSDLERISSAIGNLKKDLVTCEECFNVAQKTPCDICADPRRDKKKIMVVEEALDVLALTRTNYDGHFHVLGGVISPIDGIGPDELRIKELIAKLKVISSSTAKYEVILATDPSLEGEATAMYLARQIEKLNQTAPKKVSVTRIARGLPVGSDLEYADEITLNRAIDGRGKY